MTPEADNDPLAALQREIRRAGEQTLGLRVKWVSWGVGVLTLVSIAALAVACIPGLQALAGIGCMAVPAGILISLFGLAGAAVWRGGKREVLAKQLSRISAAERAAILLPLRSEPIDDTRALAAALIRELGVSTELSPATAPDGRSDEPSPAEPAAAGSDEATLAEDGP